MNPYGLIDLHCDTLVDYRKIGNPNTLDDPKRALSLSNLPADTHWGQFFAIFIPDSLRGQDAIHYLEYNRQNFCRQMALFANQVLPCCTAADMERAWKANKTAAFLTVEGGCVLAGDLSRVALLSKQGVVAITLVWNGENEIGSGNNTDHGLTPFGKAVIPEMERQGILVDVSHLNDHGFYDLLEVARKPFLATHSNARAICNHNRNLTDDMICEMIRRNCLIGLNYYISFLRDDGVEVTLDDLYRHAMHILELGGEKNLALGSDFDGADLPEDLNSPKKAAGLYEYFLRRGLSQPVAEGILSQNACRFLEANLN